MTQFFVSPDGNDASVGSEVAPWLTIDKVNAKLLDGSIAPGDIVRLLRGAEFFGSLAPLTTYPAAGAYVTFGGYGTAGARRPKLSVYKVLNTGGSWTLHSAGVYKIDLTNAATHSGYTASNTNIGHLLINGTDIYGHRVWSTTDLAAQWDFYCDATYLYVRSSANPTTLANDIRAAPDARGGLLCTSTKYVGLEIVGTGQHNIATGGSARSHARVYGCEFHSSGGSVNGVQTSVDDISGVAVPQRYGNGTELWIGAADIEVENNIYYDLYDVAMTAQGTLTGAQISWEDIAFRGNKVRRCQQSFEFWSAGTPQANSGFINVVAEDNDCGDAGRSWSSDVRPDRYGGVHIETFGWSLPADIKVRRNVFRGARTAYRRGVPGNPTPGLVCSDNVIALDEGLPIRIDRVNGSPGAAITYYNTIEQGDAYITAQADDTGSSFYVIPSATPDSVVGALTQLGHETGMVLGKTGALEQSMAVVREEVELLREIARQRWINLLAGKKDWAAGLAANTYVLREDGASTSGAGIAAAGAIYLDPLKTPRLRLNTYVIVNATAPACNFTFRVKPLGTPAGIAGEVFNDTAQAVVSGSSVVHTAPPAGAKLQSSVEFDCPAAGFYVVEVVTNAVIAVNSEVINRFRFEGLPAR